MREVLLVYISSSGCCNTLVTMLNNGDFGFPYCATPAFSTPEVWCRVFQSRDFSRPQVHDKALYKSTFTYLTYLTLQNHNLKITILHFSKQKSQHLLRKCKITEQNCNNIYSVSKKTSPTFLAVTLESIVGFS